MATMAQDIIDKAIRINGGCDVYGTPGSAERANGLISLNQMLGEWGADDELKFQVGDTVTASAGSATYSIAASATWNTARPVKINGAYVTVNGFDSKVGVISRGEYANLQDKSRTGPPEFLFYDGGYPTGTVYLYPTPDTTYTLHLNSTKQFGQFSGVSATADYSEEIPVAMIWNLAIRLAPEYGTLPRPDTMQFAKSTLNKLRFSHLDDSAVQNVNPHSLIV